MDDPHPAGVAPPAPPEVDDGTRAAARRLLRSGARTRRQRLDALAARAAELSGCASGRIVLLADAQVRVGASGPQPEGRPGAPPAGPLDTPDGTAAVLRWCCARTAVSGEPFAVASTTADERLGTGWPTPPAEPGSYLGVPVVDAAGRAVGTVCVFDPAPRDDPPGWTPQHVGALELVATAALAELEAAAVRAESSGDRALLELTLSAAQLGTFDVDLAAGEITLDERMLELLELPRDGFGGSAEEALRHVHPDDRALAEREYQRVARDGGAYALEHRVAAPDGTHRWLAARGATLPDEDGRPSHLLGAAYDVTGLRETQARLQRTLDDLAVGYLATDADGRVTYVNGEAVRALGRSRPDVLGALAPGLFPGEAGEQVERGRLRAVRTGRPVVLDVHHREPPGTWHEVRLVPGPGGVALHLLDITARRQAQEASETGASRLELLGAVSQELSGTVEAESAVARLAHLVVPGLADWCVVSLLDDQASAASALAAPVPRRRTGTPVAAASRPGLRDVGCWHRDEARRPLVERYARYRLTELDDAAPVWTALREGRTVLVEDATTALVNALDPQGEGRALLRRLAPETAVVLPLRGRGRTVGVLSLFAGSGRPPWSEEDLRTAADVADRAGLALDAARAYRQQRDLAEVLQRSLLTEPVPGPGVRIAVRYAPSAVAARVGGDWYDAFVQPSGATVLVVGDVLGHDTHAAAAMSQVRTIVRTFGVSDDLTPAAVLSRTDAAVARLDLATTATAVVARLEQDEDQRRRRILRLRWANAGHPPALLVHTSGAVEPLTAGDADLLLGVDPGTARRDHEVLLEEGCTLLLHTDGLVERRGESLQEGQRRLEEVLRDLAATDTDLDTLVDATLRRMVPEHPEDDVAVLALRVVAEAPVRG